MLIKLKACLSTFLKVKRQAFSNYASLLNITRCFSFQVINNVFRLFGHLGETV